ncbi:MAG TPA: signal peptidase I [Fimbriimonadales bacterium]|nr:signal peptidase I [Fimbriimonadales bacterium]
MLPLAQESIEPSVFERIARSSIETIVLVGLAFTVVRLGIYFYHSKVSPNQRNYFWKVVDWLSDAVVYATIVVFLLVRPYFIQTFRIPTPSMLDTLKINDIIIVNKLAYRIYEPQPGDIVVFKPPARAVRRHGQDENTDYVKRLIGVGGQTIEIRDSVLYRDGKKVEEPYLKDKIFGDFKLVKYNGQLIPIVRTPWMPTNLASAPEYRIPDEDKDRVWTLPAEKIPEGYFLMMGDNRNQSDDGRFWGLIDRKAIVGKAWLRILPLHRFGPVDVRK